MFACPEKLSGFESIDRPNHPPDDLASLGYFRMDRFLRTEVHYRVTPRRIQGRPNESIPNASPESLSVSEAWRLGRVLTILRIFSIILASGFPLSERSIPGRRAGTERLYPRRGKVG